MHYTTSNDFCKEAFLLNGWTQTVMNDDSYGNTPGRTTGWAGSVELCEHEPFTGHPVQVGSGGGGMAIDGQVTPSKLGEMRRSSEL